MAGLRNGALTQCRQRFRIDLLPRVLNSTHVFGLSSLVDGKAFIYDSRTGPQGRDPQIPGTESRTRGVGEGISSLAVWLRCEPRDARGGKASQAAKAVGKGASGNVCRTEGAMGEAEGEEIIRLAPPRGFHVLRQGRRISEDYRRSYRRTISQALDSTPGHLVRIFDNH